jgi:thiol-disulfide isomerase/thioredoxin
MNWKVILVGVVVVLILASLANVFLKRRSMSGFGSAQGFANPTATENSFTMYYADWCPHCQQAKPEFQQLISQGDVTVGGKKCKVRMISPEENPDAVRGKDIKGFPTFLLETTDGQQVEYKGPRNTQGYLAFINEKLGGGI